MEADDVRGWVDEHWSTEKTLGEWWLQLAESGLAFPSWPDGAGGMGASASAARSVSAALAATGVVGPPSGVGQHLGAPTVLAHGTPEQQAAWVARLASGEEAWCQLFSEPGAGSDLAGLQCRAERDGDGWVVNGQKVWNSAASRSDRGLLLARTNPDVPKHLGITYFVIDMRQPGIEARPLRQMNGDAEFDEVFLTDAYVSDDRILGGLGNGWKVAQTTLAYERTNISSRGSGNATFMPGKANGFFDQRIGDLLAHQPDQSRNRFGGGYVLPRSAALRLAAECGRTGDAVLRQRLVDYLIRVELNRLTGIRARANARGGRPGHEASIGKLALSDLARRSRDLGMSILGAPGMLSGDDAPHGGAVQHMVLSSFATGLGGGTDEIQRNVIGERALGLPREPQVDKDVPFRELSRS
jgi:alkylation response protein AidB-like acyl-CoA dehydrogenase